MKADKMRHKDSGNFKIEMRWIQGIVVLGIIVAGLLQNAQASDIRPFQVKGMDFIAISGDLEPGDDKRFRDIAFNKESAIVILQSDGGNLLAGIEIGKAIHFKAFGTYVPSGLPCASACALAWLGGMPRYVDAGSRVGFHAAYVLKNGEASESGMGNAIVGAYMNQLELSDRAIMYLTRTPPEGMQWLTANDANRFGIAVSLLNSSEATEISSGASQPVGSAQPQPTTDVALEARTYLDRLVTQWSQPNLDIRQYVSWAYADNVYYYGKNFTNAEIYVDKANFAKKWDKRSYTIEPRSMQFDCIDGSTCHASFVVAFKAYSTKNAKTSSGEAWNVISMQKFPDGWRIIQETGEIITRH